jgi:hypothetical protein
MMTRAKSNSVTPKALMVTNHPLEHSGMLEPTTFAQAAKEVHWRRAMAKELDALALNNTWNLVPAS